MDDEKLVAARLLIEIARKIANGNDNSEYKAEDLNQAADKVEAYLDSY